MSDAARRHDDFAPDRPQSVMAVAGVPFEIDPSGALWWPDERILVVADLHLEKGSAQAVRGRLVPPYDTAATLGRIAVLCLRYGPRAVIALGDSFHDRRADARIAPEDAGTLAGLARGRDWIWVAGNHDPERPACVSGDWLMEWRHGGLTFRHEPGIDDAAGEIAGHLHPVAKVRVRGHIMRRRCVVTDGARAILPAFGAYTGGLNVRDEAFEPLFPSSRPTAWMLGNGSAFPVSGSLLLRDA